jgi:excisionase family DNA binding protein
LWKSLLKTEKSAVMNAAHEKILYKPEELAERIGVSRSKVYRLIATGVIPAIRLGSALRISADAFREWVAEEQRRQAAEDYELVSSLKK